jgi:hypothetical protein
MLHRCVRYSVILPNTPTLYAVCLDNKYTVKLVLPIQHSTPFSAWVEYLFGYSSNKADNNGYLVFSLN